MASTPEFEHVGKGLASARPGLQASAGPHHARKCVLRRWGHKGKSLASAMPRRVCRAAACARACAVPRWGRQRITRLKWPSAHTSSRATSDQRRGREGRRAGHGARTRNKLLDAGCVAAEAWSMGSFRESNRQLTLHPPRNLPCLTPCLATLCVTSLRASGALDSSV